MSSSTPLIEVVTAEPLGCQRCNEHVGKEGEPHHIRYLRYIVDRYDRGGFPEFVLFMRERPEDHSTLSREAIVRALNEEPCILYDRTQWLRTFRCAPDGTPHHPGLDVGEWYVKLGLGAAVPQAFDFVPGAQFMVAGAKITARPKAFYERVLAEAESGALSQYTLERLWLIILGLGV